MSFDEDILTLKPVPNLSFEHPYLPTSLMLHSIPSASLKTNEILASSSVYGINSTTSEYCTPLTSFDWKEVEPRRIGTSTIDTTCTIWDVEKGVVETQLIPHDKEVFDIAWDIRSPAMPVAELERHQASVNAIAWAPQSCRHICSAGADGLTLI
uniref:Uncharacterized protein n=1 Tax=Solanum lycopersicum TaxID=4081 RepID=A0A3Q7FMG1_SOLLC